jgi:hypothetical protein
LAQPIAFGTVIAAVPLIMEELEQVFSQRLLPCSKALVAAVKVVGGSLRPFES